MRFPRSTPEDQGLSSIAVDRFVEALQSRLNHVHSVMLVRHGHVVAEGWAAPYRESHPHSMFSVSKSFVSTAVGFAIEEGLLDLDDAVVDLLPDDLPETVSDNLAAMRLRHLLTMTTGHSTDSVDRLDESQPNWSRQLLALPVELAPGSTFVYDSGATYLVSAILQSVTGQRVLDYLTPRLFEPLGIEGATWEQCPRGIDVGGWGLAITTEDLAAFGQTYLRAGVWRDRQVVPREWVDAATAFQVDNAGDGSRGDDGQGYGFQFWRNRHGTYRADGAFGQKSLAFPEHDTLLVMTAGLSDGQAQLDVVWEHLLPVLGGTMPLVADATAVAALNDRLAGLALPLPPGEPTSPLADRIGGTDYALPRNTLGIESVRLDVATDGTTITLVTAHGEQTVVCGSDRWVDGHAALISAESEPIAAAGAWADDDSFVATVHLTATPFALTIALDFAVPHHAAGGEVTVTVEQPVSFGPARLLHTVGHAR